MYEIGSRCHRERPPSKSENAPGRPRRAAWRRGARAGRPRGSPAAVPATLPSGRRPKRVNRALSRREGPPVHAARRDRPPRGPPARCCRAPRSAPRPGRRGSHRADAPRGGEPQEVPRRSPATPFGPEPLEHAAVTEDRRDRSSVHAATQILALPGAPPNCLGSGLPLFGKPRPGQGRPTSRHPRAAVPRCMGRGGEHMGFRWWLRRQNVTAASAHRAGRAGPPSGHVEARLAT